MKKIVLPLITLVFLFIQFNCSKDDPVYSSQPEYETCYLGVPYYATSDTAGRKAWFAGNIDHRNVCYADGDNGYQLETSTGFYARNLRTYPFFRFNLVPLEKDGAISPGKEYFQFTITSLLYQTKQEIIEHYLQVGEIPVWDKALFPFDEVYGEGRLEVKFNYSCPDVPPGEQLWLNHTAEKATGMDDSAHYVRCVSYRKQETDTDLIYDIELEMNLNFPHQDGRAWAFLKDGRFKAQIVVAK